MDIPGVTGLLEDLRVAFLLPIVYLVLVTLWLKLVGRHRFNYLAWRVALMIGLVGFVVFLTTTTYQDRSVLIELWRQNPLFYSFVYVLFVMAVAVGVAFICYWKLRPSLWRKQTTE
jgi:hypothetical protein